MLQHQLLRDKRRARIELLDEVQQNLRLCAVLGPGHDEMLPPDQLAATYKKDLHHRVVFIPRQSDDVLILPVAVRNLLLLGHLLHAVVQIPVTDRILKFQIFRRLLHLLLQAVQDRGKISIQEIQRLLHLCTVFFLRNITLAGRHALANMIIQTGPLQPDVPRQNPVTGSQLIQLIDQLNGILHRKRGGKRPEIPGFILFHLPGKKHPGKILPHGYLNIRIGFVILQHGVVLRIMLLDQVVFQHQRLQLRVGHNILEAGDLCHHFFDFRAFVRAFPEIGTHPVSQTDRLAYINNGVVLIMHDVNSRLCRKLFQFFLNLKHSLLPFPEKEKPSPSSEDGFSP